MQYKGRIITNSKSIETLEIVQVTDDATTIDTKTTTLIVGKQLAEQLYGKENVHVLDKTITPNVSWTYGKFERRNEYEKGIRTFNDRVIKDIRSSITYSFLNVFTAQYSDISHLLRILADRTGCVIYIRDDNAYIYHKNTVYGLSFAMCGYVGIDKDRVMKVFTRNRNNTILWNSDFLSKQTKKWIGGGNILMPYLYFLLKK